MRQALREVWLYYRSQVRRADFLRALRGHEREALVRLWGELELVWAKHRDDAARAANHFEANPRVYGKSTPEMVARFRGLAKGKYGKAASKWRAWREWAQTVDRLPKGILGYDPTCKSDCVEFSPDDVDGWAPVRRACKRDDEDVALGLALLAAVRADNRRRRAP
jgi:hypothetical protein